MSVNDELIVDGLSPPASVEVGILELRPVVKNACGNESTYGYDVGVYDLKIVALGHDGAESFVYVTVKRAISLGYNGRDSHVEPVLNLLVSRPYGTAKRIGIILGNEHGML